MKQLIIHLDGTREYMDVPDIPDHSSPDPDLETQVANLQEEVKNLKRQLAGERADMAAALDLLGVSP